MPRIPIFPLRHLRTASCLGSALAHGIGLAAVLTGQLWMQLQGVPDAGVRESRIVLEGGFLPASLPAEEPPPIVVADSDSDPASVASKEFVEGQIETAVAAAQTLTLDEQLEQLKRRSADLSGVSSAESIDQLARQFNALLGTKPRAERPSAEPVAGPFDFETAQLHEVHREPQETGGFRYRTVLVDAEGRRFETEVDAATGEQLHKVFEIIRGNPLLEKVYRQIVMSLLDQLSQPKPIAKLPSVP